MIPSEAVTKLAQELQKNPSVRTALQCLPSGAVFLDVHAEGRTFVLAYLPSYEMFGVDELLDSDGFGTGYQFGYRDLDEARAKLVELMRGSNKTEGQVAPEVVSPSVPGQANSLAKEGTS